MEGYRYEATSVIGFVQQVVTYIRCGYVYFVPGRVPDGKAPHAVDAKLLTKYGIPMTKGERYRRKQRGLANLQYLRFEHDFLMLATPGQHVWFRDERGSIRDVRQVAVHFRGYAVSRRQGNFLQKPPGVSQAQPDAKQRVRVSISRQAQRDLKRKLTSLATHRQAATLAAMFYQIPYEPYAPIRKQLLNLLRQVNQRRHLAGYEPVPVTAIRYRRRIVKPFEPARANSERHSKKQRAYNTAW